MQPVQSATTPQPAAAGLPWSAHTFWRGLGIGFVPLALLIAAVATTIALTTLARLVSAPAGFLVWQWIVAGVWVVGLVISTAVFLYAAFRVLRRAKGWQRDGQFSQASGTFWALGVTALLVLLPLLVAFVFPQHPAPPDTGSAAALLFGATL